MFRFRGGLICDINPAGIIDPFAVEQIRDGQQLECGMVPPWRGVVARTGGFGAHGLRWSLQTDKDANLGGFPLEDPPQVSEVPGLEMTRFDRENDLLCSPMFAFVVEEDTTIATD
jgi:hypothetical protein